MKNDDFKKMESLLYVYPHIEERIKNINIQIRRLEEECCYDDGINYGDKSSPTYKISSTVENHALDEDYQRRKTKYQREIKQLLEDQELITNGLKFLNERETKFVELKYFSGKKPTVSYIADELFVSPKTVVLLRRSAIMKLIKYIF